LGAAWAKRAVPKKHGKCPTGSAIVRTMMMRRTLGIGTGIGTGIGMGIGEGMRLAASE
jgi:hypothetical protein